MRAIGILTTALWGAVLTGCASVPPVQMNYFLPRAAVTVEVARTLGCDDQDNIFVLNAVTPKIVYSADYSQARVIRLDDLSGHASNLQSGFAFTEDGRLSGFNATQTGVGGEIVRGALALVDVVAPGAAGGDAVSMACDYVRTNGKDKVMTLTFSVPVTATPPDTDVMPQNLKFRPSPNDGGRFAEVAVLLGDLCQKAEIVPGSTAQRITMAPPRPGSRPTARSDVPVGLRQPAVVRLQIRQVEHLAGTAPCPDPTPPQTGVANPLIWEGYATIPQMGEAYTLPVPRAAIFGTQSFSFALTDSGALTTVQYGRVSGVASALGGATDIASHFEDDTAAETAASIKAEADIIAQQERLVRCRVNPTTCT